MPRGDDTIEKKLSKGNENQLKLTRTQRVMLWNGHEPFDYLWVFAASEYYWDDFRDKLIADTKRDGFDVKICLLVGPDNVESWEKRPFPDSWGSDEAFSSNISRDSTIMPDGHMTPRELVHHSPWVQNGNVYTCNPTDDSPLYTIRFIPKPEDNSVPRTSSTNIRKSLQNPHRLRSRGVTGYARNVVLRPDLLAGIIFKDLPQYSDK